ncbi:unnamed protein product [Cylindrotheca closterium]|uniref:Uncharacterized protein n=1 Tax=Cylindrotheca closterium TaxID=2856 RepID=A0AAD2CST9_9STRA|nr:unnamed protein product [Cylindrotheca closterium]
MERYSPKALVTSRTVSKQAFANKSDEKLKCASIHVKNVLLNEEEDLLGLTENTSYCTESSYEVMSANSSDIEEKSLSFSECKVEKNDLLTDSLTKKPTALQADPLISCRSQHSKVSDMSDADFGSSTDAESNLKNEIAALEYIVSKQKQYFSRKEITKRVERLKAAQSDDIPKESLHQEQAGNKTIKEHRRKPRRPSRAHQSKKSKSTEDAPKSSNGFVDVKQQITPSSLSQPLVDRSRSDRTRKFVNPKEESVSTTTRPRSRKHRRSSISIDHAGQITEEFAYRPRPSKAVAPSNGDSRTAKEDGSTLRTSVKRGRQKGNLWKAMVKRYSTSSRAGEN